LSVAAPVVRSRLMIAEIRRACCHRPVAGIEHMRPIGFEPVGVVMPQVTAQARAGGFSRTNSFYLT
jgi:hypothetical protein